MSETKKQYQALLYQQKRRNDRNVRLLVKLENIEKKAAFLQAKTDRIKSLKSIYKNQFENYEVEYRYPKQFPKRNNPYLKAVERNYALNYDYSEIPPKYTYFEDKMSHRYSEPVCVIKDITLEDAIEEISKRFVLIPKTKTNTSDTFDRQNSKVDHFDKKAQYRYDIDKKNYEEFDYIANKIQDNTEELSEGSEENYFPRKNKQNADTPSNSEKYSSLLKYPEEQESPKIISHDNPDTTNKITKNEILEITNPESQLECSKIKENNQEVKPDIENEINVSEKVIISAENLEIIDQVEEEQAHAENIQFNNTSDQPEIIIQENNIQYEVSDEISYNDTDNLQYSQNQLNTTENLQPEFIKDETEINDNQMYEHTEEQNQDFSNTQPLESDAGYYNQQNQDYDTGIYTQENITNSNDAEIYPQENITYPDDAQQPYDQTEYEHQQILQNDQADLPVVENKPDPYYNQEENYEVQQQYNDPNYYSQENQNYPAEIAGTEQETVDPNYYPQNVAEGDQNQYYYDQSQENTYYNREGINANAEGEAQNVTYQETENYNPNDYATDQSNVQYQEGEYQEYANPEQYNVENIPENPEQYIENNDMQPNSQYYGENIVNDDLAASEIEKTDIQPLKILDSDIEYENSVRDDQSKQESDFDFSISQQQ